LSALNRLDTVENSVLNTAGSASLSEVKNDENASQQAEAEAAAEKPAAETNQKPNEQLDIF